MTKPGNWPPWLKLVNGNDRNSGTSLVELLIALAIAILLFTIMITTLQMGLRGYRTAILHSEAMQNACIALNWLQKDLQATQILTISANKTQVTLELPRVETKDRTTLQWYKAVYLFQRSSTQLLRNVSGSYNIVAEGVVNFTITLDKAKRIAAITVTSQSGPKRVEVHRKVWLRNLRY